jgi:two-component system sensor histidine kinase EvgS
MQLLTMHTTSSVSSFLPLPSSMSETLASGLILFLGLCLCFLLVRLSIVSRALRKQQQMNWKLQAMVAHEIRTPLSAMSQLLDLATEPENQATAQAELLPTVRNTMHTMLQLMDDMLIMSKLQSGQSSLNLQPTHLSSLMTDVVRTYEVLAQKKKLQFRYSISHADTHLRIDASKIRQILNNLLSNAIKFTTHGSIELKVDCKSTGSGRAWVCISVKDTGIGIAAEDYQQVFTAFSNAGENNRQLFGGFGLGLSLSRQLAEQMQGSLKIDSVQGQGTQIKFQFECEQLTAQTGDFTGLRALIADDNSANQMLLKLQLEQLGLSVRCSDHGQQALQDWIENSCDILFCDLHMPELNGEQLIRSIREIEEEQNKPPVPIIAISAEPAEEKIPEGAQYRLSKPSNTEDLLHALRLSLPHPVPDDPYRHVHLEVLHQLSQGDGDFERNFINSILKNNQQDLERLQESFLKKDMEQTAETLHRLLGIVRLLGGDFLTEHCLQLEKALREKQSHRIKALLPEVEKGIQSIDQELRHYQQKLENLTH